jgi:hypothetical protein
MTRSEEYKNKLEEARRLSQELDQSSIPLNLAEEKCKRVIENLDICKKLLLEGTHGVKIVRKGVLN